MTIPRVPYSTERTVPLIAKGHIRASLEAPAGSAVERSFNETAFSATLLNNKLGC